MSVRAVIFDLGDTLFRLDPLPDVRPCLAAVLSRLGVIEAGVADEVAARVLSHVSEQRAANAGLMESNLHGMFVAAFEALGLLSGPAVADACADILGDADLSRFAAPAHLSDDLHRLGEGGLVLGAVSNTTTRGEVLDGFLEAVGVRHVFAAVVYSSVHGYKKPHRSIYEQVLTRIGIDAGSALFVGDRVEEDVLGPQSVGMRAVLTHEYRQEPLRQAQPLAVIRNMAELRGLLGSL